MYHFKKDYLHIVAYILLSLIMFTGRICSSDVSRQVSPAFHEPFEVSMGGDSSDDATNGVRIEGFTIPKPVLDTMFKSSSDSSPEQDIEDDILCETALKLGLPRHLSSKMTSLKPFVKLVLQNKKKSPKESSEFVDPLKRASSHQELPVPRERAHTRRSSAQDSIPGSLLVGMNDDDDVTIPVLSPEKQRERNKIQQLLLEAAQTALEAKEAELKARSSLLEEKERKLEEKFSKKVTATITGVVSAITTLIGTLTAYYSSQCK